MLEREKQAAEESLLSQAAPWRSASLAQACSRDQANQYTTGIVYLFCQVILSLSVARLVFGFLARDFEWLPANLGSGMAFIFFYFHATIGPLFHLFSDLLAETKHLLFNEPRRHAVRVLRDFFSGYLRNYLFNGAMAYMAVYGVLVSYTNLKPSIPLLNDRLYDDILFRCDSWILKLVTLGGHFIIPKNPSITHCFDTMYFFLWPLACLTLLLASREEVVFWRYTSAWCIAFVLSLPFSILFPTMGPAFFKPELYQHISGTCSAGAMERLWSHYQSFKSYPLQTPIVTANGIVGMPSLHIALCYLSSLAIGTLYPRLRFFMAGVVFLFVVATVYLGWHYLLDGLGGIGVGWIAHKISCRWFYRKTV
ncbi:phosphatase PAP2 family protein [Geomonas terrae]|uniref:Phosphatase PAP2 family protein n=1 Tax=Geomonas terrae TaxID=2562681 RepID=A0A4S1CFL3_9BACT|nr:phosphatase PAP2 family protein [Geomonas terrae]TGU72335.1 phosphatase PAP2 family protein [Geomonas terrae]